MIRLLSYTSLYPNAAQPSHGVFVENRLRHLVAGGQAATRVIAPVPWFPLRHRMFGGYATFAAAPAAEQRHGIAIHHPRYPLIPKVGMSLAPGLMSRFTLDAVRHELRARPFDLIDAHYFYPDGVAAALIGRALGKPVVITARGTDLNLIPDHARPRRLIQWAAAQAAGLITVCQALKDRLIDLGVPAERITVLRNGVDLSQFQPPDRARARAALGLTGPTLVSVGALIERKAHDLTIRALSLLPDWRLLVAGEGPERGRLAALARNLGVADRVRLVGPVAHDKLAEIYGAADISVLASSREGWANVLLEAMACGTPVVASDVWGTPEVVAAPAAGRLMRERTPEALAEAVAALAADPPDRALTRAYAERFDWQATTLGQIALFTEILERATLAP